MQPRFDDNYIFGDNELPHNANYILSVKPLNPTNRITTQNGKVSLNNSIRCRSSIIYFDGLGRTKEQIGISASPDGSDILSLQQYDGINRFYKQWLPITNHNDGQPLNVSEYISFATNEYSDNRPFKEYIYENSDLDRITNKKRAGETYQNNPQIIDYDINNENDNVRIFDIISIDSIEKIQYKGLYAANIKPLTVKYYDNYDFLNIAGNNLYSLNYIPPSYGDTANLVATSLLTGERTYNLSDDGFVVSSLYYDKLGQLIESRQVQHDNGIYIVKHSYNFDGTTNQKNISHIHPEAEYTIFEKYQYQYDNQGRLKDVKYITLNTDTIQLFALKYDKIGRVAQKLRHNLNDSITYNYNINNQLTGIHNSNFTEKLFYADSLPMPTEKLYNGNISVCQTTILDTTISMIYNYDSQNRLMETKCRLEQFDDCRLSEKITYDCYGNIQNLKRFHNGALINDLSYFYSDNSNQLIAITDAIETPSTPIEYYNTKQYHDNNHSDTDFTYDKNGNMTSDKDRRITQIQYNLLNLPDTILFANGNKIINMYDAKGTKYKTIYATNLLTAVTPFENVNNYLFEADSIDYYTINREHNYEYHTTSDTSIIRLYNIEGYMPSYNTYCYFYKDHLGNNVVTRQIGADGNDSIIQKISYYVTGLPMPNSWGLSSQALTYNGKEFVAVHGLNTYDYEFRSYYATIGRFTSIDPMADFTTTSSPYSYSNNNWVNSIDYKGLFSIPNSPILSNDEQDAYNLTKINNKGIVIEHIDDKDDTRVIVVKDDGTEEEIGTEIEDENYKVGRRVFFDYGNSILALYNFHKGIYILPTTSTDEKIRRWLKAKIMTDAEEAALNEFIRPIATYIAMKNPAVSIINDAMVIINSEDLYGNSNLGEVDKIKAIFDAVLSALNGRRLRSKDTHYLISSFNKYNNLKTMFNEYEK